MLGPIPATALLAAWEHGFGRSLLERGLVLLGLAVPEAAPKTLADLAIGDRNRALLALRRHLFGSCIASHDVCASCGERLEVEFPLALIAARPAATDRIFATWGRHRLEFRLPSTADLSAVQAAPGEGDRRLVLLERCLLNPDGLPDPRGWPADLQERVAARMAAADPQADVRIAIDCAACGNSWQRRFDIVSFLWSEVDRLARRLLAEVHLLASRYGWSEQAILNLSAWRRHIYLDLARQ